MKAIRVIKKIVIVLAILIGLLFLVIFVKIFVYNWKNRTPKKDRIVEFQDANMAIMICNNLNDSYSGYNLTPETITYQDVWSVRRLKIGYTGYYDTLEDIKLCKNLEWLYIGGGLWKEISLPPDKEYLLEIFPFVGGSLTGTQPKYSITAEGEEPKESPKRVEQMEQELTEILKSCKKIDYIRIENIYNNLELTNLEFLTKGKNLETISLQGEGNWDYNVLKKCKKLKILMLDYSELSRAEQVKDLSFLDRIDIEYTPLEQNMEEYEKLVEQFPNTTISSYNNPEMYQERKQE